MAPESRKIALHLGSLREHLQGEAEVARTLGRVREIGFDHVQLAGLGALPTGQLKALTSALGLGICATHEDMREVLTEPRKVGDRLAELGCRFAACSAPPHALTTLEKVEKLADDVSRAGEVLRSQGRLLVLHHHAAELRKLAGKTILDRINERSDPVMVHAQLDTYWLQAGGVDPAAYCARLSGRLPLLRLNDYAVDAQGAPCMAALGEGNLNFPVILREADAAACEWFVVAHESGAGDPFAAIALSLSYLKAR